MDFDRISNGRLLATLRRAGVELLKVDRKSPTQPDVEVGDYVIPMSQPNSAFARAVLIPLKYPDLRDETGRPIPPYDVTAHALPLLMNVDIKEIRDVIATSQMTKVSNVSVATTPCASAHPCLTTK